MNKPDLEELELRLLLKAISNYYGHDFHDYAKASMIRRVHKHMEHVGVTQISGLIPLFLHNRDAFNEFVRNMSVVVTDMFRDPTFFLAIRKEVVPILKTYPFIKIWHAGCASGQEVYSMAILLEEEGLLDRCQIYATDFNDHALNIARKGIYPQGDMLVYEKNYQIAGGRGALTNYCHQSYESVKFSDRLTEKITFANHNLVTDGVFGEMNLVFCRNVLIYFNRTLQNRVLTLLADSLVPRGLLCIGRRENLIKSAITDQVEPLNNALRIYRKKI